MIDVNKQDKPKSHKYLVSLAAYLPPKKSGGWWL